MAVIDLRLDPTERELRWFAPLLLVFFGVVGAIARWGFDAAAAGYALWAVGGLLASLYAAVPAWRLSIYRGWIRATYPIGWLVSHVVLAGVYYLLITPIGLLSRVVRRDPLTRRFDREATSYWVARKTRFETKQYFDQF